MTKTKAKSRPKRVIDAKLRVRIEAAVEALIAALDHAEADPDIEDDDEGGPADEDDEPSLGWTELRLAHSCYAPIDRYGVDCELQDEDDEDNGDREPSLGSIERSPIGGDVGVILANRREGYGPSETRTESGSQQAWGVGDTSDLEDEHDGREPDVDDEPSLGSFDRLTNQLDAWRQKGEPVDYRTDAEQDDADREPDVDDEPNGDLEPDLGWTVDGFVGRGDDREG